MQDNLTDRLHRGDTDALEEVIDRYGMYTAKIISAFLNKRLPQEDMEEAVSDVFVALWNSRGRLDSSRELRPYIAEISRNAARQRLRGLHPVEPLPENEDIPDQGITPEQAAEQSERAELVRTGIELLSPEYQELFLRFYYLGQTVSEIAAVTGQNIFTVKSRLLRGRKKLKDYLAERGLA